MCTKLLRITVISALTAAIALTFAAGAGGRRAIAQQPDPAIPAVHPAAVKQPIPVNAATFSDGGFAVTEKISPVLDKLYRVDLLSRVAANRPLTAGAARGIGPEMSGLIAAKQLHIDNGGRVQVWVNTAVAPGDATSALVALGMYVQRTDDTNHLVQGFLPINELHAASGIADVNSVELPSYGFVQSGSKLTEGDGILGSATLRSQLTGADGTGVRVGVISDGMEGLAASQGSGDLGAVDITTCNVAPPTGSPPVQPLPTDPGAGAEGTAMSEIVHDMAPAASLMFGYFDFSNGTALDFNNAVSCLAAHNDVVVDDVGFFNAGPYDGTSIVSANTNAALNNAANPIRGYYTAVANQAANHWRGTYSNSGTQVTGTGGSFWDLTRFTAGSGTTDAGGGLPCANPALFCGDAIDAPAGANFTVFLEWNDPFTGSTSDYDLLMLDNNAGTITPENVTRQIGGSSHPTESFSFTNTSGVENLYAFLIGNYKGLAAAKTFDMYVLCDTCLFYPTGLAAPDDFAQHNFNTLAHSVPNQSDSTGGVVSVGAISAADPGNDSIDFYSSRGPTSDNRTKPDISGIDCVQVTGDGGFPSDFCGSSAAAPGVAAVAALMLSCNPTLLTGKTGSVATATARTTLRTALLNGALDLGTAGVDNTYGSGRARTANSEPLAGCKDTDGDGYPDGLETTLGKNPTVACATMRADVTGDGNANIVDLTTLSTHFLQAVPPAPARIDQNNDGSVNIIDLTLESTHFLQSVSACP